MSKLEIKSKNNNYNNNNNNNYINSNYKSSQIFAEEASDYFHQNNNKINAFGETTSSTYGAYYLKK